MSAHGPHLTMQTRSLGVVLAVAIILWTAVLGLSAQQTNLTAGADPSSTPQRPAEAPKETPPAPLPAAPENFIHDEAGILDESRTKKLGIYLTEQAVRDDVRVYLVTMPQLQGITPGERAVALRKAWMKDTEFGGVLLYNPISRTFGFAVTPRSNEVMEPGTLETIGQTSKTTLTRLRNPAQALRELAMDFEYELRSAREGSTKRNQLMVPIRLTAIILVVSVLAGGFVLLLRHANAQNYFGHAVLFPVRSVEPRLGGQHSGGHSVEIDLDRK